MGKRTGFTLIELLIVVALIGILAALGAPFMMAAKASANESSAIGTMRALHSSQATYSNVCGNGQYSLSLASLVTGQFASPDIDVTPKSGFTFALAAGLGSVAGAPDCAGLPTRSGYYFSAVPLAPGTGRRSFATTHGGVIFQNTVAAVAPPEPLTVGGTISSLESK